MKFTRKAMKADVPSVAMGDIAFNLLIFFVILAKAQDDSHVQWQPAAAADLQKVANTKVSVAIDNQNKLHFNGQEIGQAQLAKRIEETLGAAPAGEGLATEAEFPLPCDTQSCSARWDHQSWISVTCVPRDPSGKKGAEFVLARGNNGTWNKFGR